jgi:hypothetical protein
MSRSKNKKNKITLTENKISLTDAFFLKQPSEINRLWEKKQKEKWDEEQKRGEIEQKNMPKLRGTTKGIYGRMFFYSPERNKWYPNYQWDHYLREGSGLSSTHRRRIRYISDKMSEHLDKHGDYVFSKQEKEACAARIRKQDKSMKESKSISQESKDAYLSKNENKMRYDQIMFEIYNDEFNDKDDKEKWEWVAKNKEKCSKKCYCSIMGGKKKVAKTRKSATLKNVKNVKNTSKLFR